MSARPLAAAAALLLATAAALPAQQQPVAPSATEQASARQQSTAARHDTPTSFLGFDRNDYPGDAALPALRRHFRFTGFWLNNPPGATANTWLGHRPALRSAGFGFLVLWNGRLDADLLRQAKRGTAPAALGRADAALAIAAAHREGFPSHTIVFLDQEEGGRLLPEQLSYLLSFTEALAASGLRPGVYASGQPVPDALPTDPHHTITTAQDIADHVRAQHLHPIALWVAQDTCPPAPGCVLSPPALAASGTPDTPAIAPLVAWQFAQSPRRPDLTRTCGTTYAPNGNCIAPDLPALFLDLSTAATPDPSDAR